jgi:hypothetical protein
MRIYPTDVCQEHYYLRNGKLCDNYEPDSVCLFAPGDVVWRSDLQMLHLYKQDTSDNSNLDAVAAKYFINREPPED